MKHLLVPLLFIIAACSSKPKPTTEVLTPPGVEEVMPDSTPRAEEQIDVDAIRSQLKMDFPIEQLGYREKKFNTCEVGSGYSTVNNCRKRTLVIIHFHLVCRSSEGTVSEVITQADLQPIGSQSVKWILKNITGETFTNPSGFGQIVMVANESQRTQRVRLVVGNDFLAQRAGEMNQLIAPGNWCR